MNQQPAKQSRFKRMVKHRMRETGERYRVARAWVLANKRTAPEKYIPRTETLKWVNPDA